MLLLPPANWGIPFNPTTPDRDAELIPVQTPNGPLPPAPVALVPIAALYTHPVGFVA